MPTAFVTGVTGQDGGYLVDRLLPEGVRVHGLVRGTGAQARMRATYPAITVHVGDLRDCGSVGHLTAAIEPHEVYNLGGISSVATSWRHRWRPGRCPGWRWRAC